MSNFDNIARSMEEKGGGSQSDFFKFPVGDTKIRIMTDFHQTYSLYEGEYPNSKYVRMLSHYQEPKKGQSIKTSAWAWAVIRGAEELKIVQFPYSLIKALQGLKNDPEWAFESFPMDYDLTISNTGEGGVRYSLRGSPKKTSVPESIVDSLSKKRTCEQIAESIIAKQKSKEEKEVKEAVLSEGPAYPDDDLKPDDIPF